MVGWFKHSLIHLFKSTDGWLFAFVWIVCIYCNLKSNLNQIFWSAQIWKISLDIKVAIRTLFAMSNWSKTTCLLKSSLWRCVSVWSSKQPSEPHHKAIMHIRRQRMSSFSVLSACCRGKVSWQRVHRYYTRPEHTIQFNLSVWTVSPKDWIWKNKSSIELWFDVMLCQKWMFLSQCQVHKICRHISVNCASGWIRAVLHSILYSNSIIYFVIHVIIYHL